MAETRYGNQLIPGSHRLSQGELYQPGALPRQPATSPATPGCCVAYRALGIVPTVRCASISGHPVVWGRINRDLATWASGLVIWFSVRSTWASDVMRLVIRARGLSGGGFELTACQQAVGRPDVFFWEPLVIDGEPSVIDGEPSVIDGEPSAMDGKPIEASGRACRFYSDTDRLRSGSGVFRTNEPGVDGGGMRGVQAGQLGCLPVDTVSINERGLPAILPLSTCICHYACLSLQDYLTMAVTLTPLYLYVQEVILVWRGVAMRVGVMV